MLHPGTESVVSLNVGLDSRAVHGYLSIWGLGNIEMHVDTTVGTDEVFVGVKCIVMVKLVYSRTWGPGPR